MKNYLQKLQLSKKLFLSVRVQDYGIKDILVIGGIMTGTLQQFQQQEIRKLPSFRMHYKLFLTCKYIVAILLPEFKLLWIIVLLARKHTLKVCNSATTASRMISLLGSWQSVSHDITNLPGNSVRPKISGLLSSFKQRAMISAPTHFHLLSRIESGTHAIVLLIEIHPLPQF